jgi:serine/threonine protein kinase/tetratricopeptide (TPR) repeat protein
VFSAILVRRGIVEARVATSGSPVSNEEDDPLVARIQAAAPQRGAGPDLADRACTARIRSLRPAAALPLPTVAGYVIEGSVGKGGFGEVYRARHPRLRRDVALKRLHAGSGHGLSRTARALREAVSLGRLNHPNVVQVFDVLENDDGTFIAMEFVDGMPLTRWQREVLEVYTQVAEGLAAAHAAGLLHLDLKPANVLLGRDGRPRVVDFGVARSADAIGRAVTLVDGMGAAHDRSESDRSGSDGAEAGTPTEDDGPIPRGTIPYGSPEQLRGDLVDARSDQYSFCVALYEALHGGLPPAAARLLPASGGAQPTPGRRVPRRLEAVLVRGLQPAPRDRWPSMLALIEELRRPGPLERPSTWGFAGAALVALSWLALGSRDVPAACSDPSGRLAGVWDDARRTELARAFASGAPWSRDLGDRLSARLDAHGTAWLEQLSETCSQVEDQQRTPLAWARLDCLQRERARLGEVVGALLRADLRDPREAEKADDLALLLRSPRSCIEAPSDAPAWDSAAIVELDRAEVLLASGEPVLARDAAASAEAMANSVGDPALQAEVLLVVASTELALDDPAAALSTLEKAAASSIASGRDDLTHEAWRSAAKVAANRLRDVGAAGRWLRFAEAGVDRLANPGRARADTLDVRGNYESLRGDDVAAEAAHREALGILDSILDDDDPRLADTWLNLAGVASRLGKLDEADSLDRLTLELRERRLGASHPRTAEALLGLAVVQWQRGDAAAMESAERAYQILEAAYGPESIRLAPILTRQAETWFAQGQRERAKTAASRAWALQRAHLPAGHIERAQGGLAVLLDIANAEKDYDRQLELGRIAVDEARARKDALAVAAAETVVAWALLHRGELDESEQIYAALRSDPAGDPVVLAYSLGGLAAIDVARGHFADAVPRLREALAELARLGDGHEAGRAELEAQLSLAERRLGAATPP